MKIKFIGTGSGKASLIRYHSSILFNSQNYNLLVDSGDGISRALLNQKISYNSINSILFSHFHPDHYSGFTSLIVQMKMNLRKTSLDIIAHKSDLEFIKELLYRSYVFEEKLPFKINYKKLINKKHFRINNEFGFTAIQNNHLSNKKHWDKNSKLSFSSSSFLFHYKNTNILLTSDVGDSRDLYLFKNQKIDLMISEITHIDEVELLEAFKLLKPQKLYITHLSDEDEKKVVNVKSLLTGKNGKNIIQAYDGLSIKI